MSLEAGQTLSHYRLIEKLGEGGMGVVWKALDTKLEREVAIKVLTEAFAEDQERLNRFKREAKTLAALNHPNIAAIHGLEESNGLSFLVMELVPGQTLAERLAAGPIPMEEALTLCRQIAEALEAAQDKEIIHRDLKPGNIKITPQGKVKVLDFGLAKEVGDGSAPDDPAQSPTVTSMGTRDGVIMGTAEYMSPEQARGKPVDRRTDIWAFGCVLYEALTGHRAFTGETVSDTLAAVLTKELDWSLLPDSTPATVRSLLRRCLQKDARQRLHAIADARIEIDEFLFQPAGESSPWMRWSMLFWATLIAVALIVLGYSFRHLWLPQSSPADQRIMLAVLPLKNFSEDPEQEFFSDGMTDEMITQLGRLNPGQLGVIAPTSAFRLKNTEKDIDQIGRELGVAFLVDGSVRRSGDQVRIAARLIQVSDRTQLWAESYERSLTDVFAIQSDVARRIAHALSLQLLPAKEDALAHGPETSFAAYDAYLKGRYYWNRRTKDGAERSLEFFRQAIEDDPEFAPAYAGLSDAYTVLGFYGYRPANETSPLARQAALKAVEIDDTLAEAHTSLATSLEEMWDWAASEREFKRAIELNPNYATARQWYALLLTTLGRPEEAIVEARRALKLDPLSLIINENQAYHLYFARRYDEALEACRKTLEMDPDFFEARITMGLIYEATSMFEEAVGEYRKAIELSGETPRSLSMLGTGLAAAGDREQAEEILRRIEKDPAARPFDLASLRAALGHLDRAYGLLFEAVERRELVNEGVRQLMAGPRFDDLRSDRRFEELRQHFNLPR